MIPGRDRSPQRSAWAGTALRMTRAAASGHRVPRRSGEWMKNATNHGTLDNPKWDRPEVGPCLAGAIAAAHHISDRRDVIFRFLQLPDPDEAAEQHLDRRGHGHC